MPRSPAICLSAAPHPPAGPASAYIAARIAAGQIPAEDRDHWLRVFDLCYRRGN